MSGGMGISCHFIRYSLAGLDLDVFITVGLPKRRLELDNLEVLLGRSALRLLKCCLEAQARNIPLGGACLRSGLLDSQAEPKARGVKGGTEQSYTCRV